MNDDSNFKNIYTLMIEDALTIDFEKATVNDLKELDKKLNLNEISQIRSSGNTST